MVDSSGYIACLDVGDRRIGVALASTIARLPAPLTTIDRDDVIGLVELIKKHEVETLVVGLPRDMNGHETEQTKKTQIFVASVLSQLELPVVWQDESVTSIRAEERLKARGVSYNKGDIDAESAVIILEDYLASTYRRTA